MIKLTICGVDLLTICYWTVPWYMSGDKFYQKSYEHGGVKPFSLQIRLKCMMK
jgi:hypothetical protein